VVFVHTSGTFDCVFDTKRLGSVPDVVVDVDNRLLTFAMDTVRDCDDVNMVLVGCGRVVILLETAIVIFEPLLILLDMVVGLDLAIIVDDDDDEDDDDTDDNDDGFTPLCELIATVFSQTFDEMGGVGFALIFLGNICNISTSGSLMRIVIRE
jgi:hypothetical protein